MRLLLLLATALVMLTAGDCKKPKYDPYSDKGLPPATQEGKNIFACRVNGKAWISESGIYALGANASRDSLYVFGSFGKTEDFDNLHLALKGNIEQGMTYKLDDVQSNFARMRTNQDCEGNLLGYMEPYYAIDGSLMLSRFDTINKIISGRFHCIIPVSDCDTLNITDGRFDVRYY